MAKSFLDLSKGHIISQAIGAICSVLVAEIYGADALGVFSVFFTSTTMLSTFNTVRLESVLFLKQDRFDKENNSIGLMFVVSLISIILLFVSFGIPTSILQKYLISRKLLYIIIFGAFLNSIKSIFYNMILLDDGFRKIKFSKILFTCVKYAIQLFGFFIIIHYWGLIFGYVFAILFTVLYLYRDINIDFKKFSFDKFKSTIYEYRGLLKYAFPGDVVNTIAINVFPLLLIATYGEKLTGNYFMSYLILSIPLTFLYSVVAPVFFKKTVCLVKVDEYKELYDYTKTIVKRTFLLISCPLFFLFFFGNEIIVFFLGQEWKNTGLFLEIFSLLFAFRVLYSPISSLEETFKKNHVSLVVNIYFVVVLFTSVFLGKQMFSIFQIATVISILSSLGYLFLLAYFYRLLKSKVS